MNENLSIREMQPEEMRTVADYFHRATPEYLELLGVDPTRVPKQKDFTLRYAYECRRPLEERHSFHVIWKLGERPVGFSSIDRIVLNQQAHMHLNIFQSEHRNAGYGVVFIMKSVEIYFAKFGLRRIVCEPNAFNVAPNRTLQRAGFKYVKTYMTVPGPLSYHQAVTRWLLEKPPL